MTLTAAVITLVGAFTLGVLPAAASTQSNYIKALHRAEPSTKAFSNKKLVALAKGDCSSLSFAPISDIAGVLDEPSNVFTFPRRRCRSPNSGRGRLLPQVQEGPGIAQGDAANSGSEDDADSGSEDSVPTAPSHAYGSCPDAAAAERSRGSQAVPEHAGLFAAGSH